jgi:hypothetical protein
MDQRTEIGVHPRLVACSQYVGIGVTQGTVVVGVERGGGQHQLAVGRDGHHPRRGRPDRWRQARCQRRRYRSLGPRLHEPAEQHAGLGSGSSDQRRARSTGGQGEQAAFPLERSVGRAGPSARQACRVEERGAPRQSGQLSLHATGHDDRVPLPPRGGGDGADRDTLRPRRTAHPPRVGRQPTLLDGRQRLDQGGSGVPVVVAGEAVGEGDEPVEGAVVPVRAERRPRLVDQVGRRVAGGHTARQVVLQVVQ